MDIILRLYKINSLADDKCSLVATQVSFVKIEKLSFWLGSYFSSYHWKEVLIKSAKRLLILIGNNVDENMLLMFTNISAGGTNIYDLYNTYPYNFLFFLFTPLWNTHRESGIFSLSFTYRHPHIVCLY